MTHLVPEAAVYAVEPEGFDDTARSLVSGQRERNREGAHSFCDALLAPMPGELTFEVNRRLLAGGLVVTDPEVAEAMRLAFRHLKLVVEPGGAVALAAVLAGRIETKGRTIAVVQAVASWPSGQPTAVIRIFAFGCHEAGTTREAGRRRPGRMRIKPTSRPKS